MAIETKDKNPTISAAILDIAGKSDAAIAQKLATEAILKAQSTSSIELKGQTSSRLKSDVLAPSHLAIPAAAPKTAEEVASDRYKQLQLMEAGRELTDQSLTDWIKNNILQLGSNFDPDDKIDMSRAKFLATNPADREITAQYEDREQSAYTYTTQASSSPSTGRHSSKAGTSVTNTGFKAPTFKLDKHEARTNLAADIRTVSEMYAAEAGMSPKDFAKVMGGIATIESSFGVLREVKGTKYPSSAGGAFHYLNGTIAGETSQAKATDPRIANRVADLGVTFETVMVKRSNGKIAKEERISDKEAWVLKEDNILAGSILAKQIIETARKYPELKGDIEALTTRVYQSHNLGDAGARALARGGRNALDAVDERAADNNPMFFRGASSDTEINNRYKKFVSNAVASADSLIEGAFGNTVAPTLAQNKPQPVKVTTASLPTREPA